VWLDLARLVGRVGNDPLEVGIADEVVDVRPGDRVTQERLGEEDDEGYRNMLVR
jgi:hypothetical protein